MPIRHGVRASKNVKTQPRRSGFLTMTRLADMLPFLQINRFTRVYRAHVLAALTRPLARRLCRLRPPPPSPAPCRACGGRARRSHRPALASPRYWLCCAKSPPERGRTNRLKLPFQKSVCPSRLPSALGRYQRRGAGTDRSPDVLQGQCPRRRGSTSASLANSARSRRLNGNFYLPSSRVQCRTIAAVVQCL